MRKALAILGASLVFAGCNPQPDKTNATPTASPTATASAGGLPPVVISGKGTKSQPIRAFYSRGNRREYALVALAYTSTGAQGASTAVFTTATLHFYAKDGSTMTATAPKATVDERANRVTLSGGAHATNSNGQTLSCDTLVYDRMTEMLHGDGNVTITDAHGLTATAQSIDSDISLTHTRMQ